MYYNKILKIWVINPVDYFLLSALIGSIITSWLKNYLSEKQVMERLKASIIQKLDNKPILGGKKSKIIKVYKWALMLRGGVDDIVKYEFYVQKELTAIAKIFFKAGRLFIGLILAKSNIRLDY